MNLEELRKKSKKAMNDISENAQKVDLKDVKEKGKKLAENISQNAKKIDVNDMKEKGKKVAGNINDFSKQGGIKKLLSNKKILIVIAAVFLVVCFIVGNNATESEKDKEAIAAALEDIRTSSFEDAEDQLAGVTGKKATKLKEALNTYNHAAKAFYVGMTDDKGALSPEELCKYTRSVLKQINKSYKDYEDFSSAVKEFNETIDSTEQFVKDANNAVAEVEELISEGKYLESEDLADEWVDKIDKFDKNSTISLDLLNDMWQYSSSSTLHMEEKAAQRKELMEEEKQELRANTEAIQQEIQELYDAGKKEEAKQKIIETLEELGVDSSRGVSYSETNWGVSDDFMNFVDSLFPELLTELSQADMPMMPLDGE